LASCRMRPTSPTKIKVARLLFFIAAVLAE
jgi:hypothetical protein